MAKQMSAVSRPSAAVYGSESFLAEMSVCDSVLSHIFIRQKNTKRVPSGSRALKFVDLSSEKGFWSGYRATWNLVATLRSR